MAARILFFFKNLNREATIDFQFKILESATFQCGFVRFPISNLSQFPQIPLEVLKASPVTGFLPILHFMRTITLLIFGALIATSCSQPAEKTADQKAAPPPSVIDANMIKTHIQKLSADEMEGRAPGSHGEELATAYIGDYFKSLGLKTSTQAVPLVGVTSTASPLKITGGQSRALKFGDDFVAWSKQQKDKGSSRSPATWCSPATVSLRRSTTGMTSKRASKERSLSFSSTILNSTTRRCLAERR